MSSVEPNYQKLNDEEIDLIQLFGVVRKRKAIFGAVFLLVLLCGGAATTLKKPVYSYTTKIKLELVAPLNREEPIMRPTPSAVLASIKDVYLPSAISEIRTQNRTVTASPSHPRKSSAIILTSKGVAGQKELITKLHNLVITPLLTKYRSINDELRHIYLSEKKFELAAAEGHLADLNDNEKLISARIKRTDSNRLFLKNTLNDARGSLSFWEIAQIKERLQFTLSDNEEQLTLELASNIRNKELQSAIVEKLKLDINRFSSNNAEDTMQVVGIAVSSEKPIGPAPLVLFLLFAITAVILSIFTVFITEFISNFKLNKQA